MYSPKEKLTCCIFIAIGISEAMPMSLKKSNFFKNFIFLPTSSSNFGVISWLSVDFDYDSSYALRP